jgi:hypothetical protein|uniref:Uncharacterized protein n=1 Tax=viral metagenome TaxID=1070528 RepID=A0A6H1ZBM7_9ZZZZ
MGTNPTPGPWRVESGTSLVWGACDPHDMTSYGMGYPIIECRVSPASMWAANKGPNIAEGRANARLCAAAPELLEVVRAFVAETVDYAKLNKLGDPEKQHNVKWARSVIAKAAGS